MAFLLALSPAPLTVFPPFLLLWPRPTSLLSTPGSSLCLERSSLMELHGPPSLAAFGSQSNASSSGKSSWILI